MEFISQSIVLDAASLPYNRRLLTFLRLEHAQGRAIYLASGANIDLAKRVASHLNVFTGVLGSDRNSLAGSTKLQRIRDQIDYSEFAYVGGDVLDLSLFTSATTPMVANPTRRLTAFLHARGIFPFREFRDRSHPIKSLRKAIRLHQWSKNLLILVPLLLAHQPSLKTLATALLAFFSFSLAASATYILNDLLDIDADRRHLRKRHRPFASGDLSVSTGLALVTGFLGLALFATRFLPHAFSLWLGFYLASTLAYSLYLKRIPIVDVLVLSGLYTLRMQAGSAATHTPISHWLAGLSVFLFLSLAMVKRFAELENLRASGSLPNNGRGYHVSDIEQMRSFGTASAYAAVIIFAIYISGHDVMALYRQPRFLWLIVPLMILWLSRVWLVASRGELNEDPVVFALTDRLSLFIGIMAVALTLLAL
jgi:4-hydroxybenzoate polyprenyltransferase